MSSYPHPPDRLERKYSSSSSGLSRGECSYPEVLTTAPIFSGGAQGSSWVARRVTQISQSPYTPGLLYATKYISRPSDEMFTSLSLWSVLIGAPRFSGSPQSFSSVCLLDTHISQPPSPPGLTKSGGVHLQTVGRYIRYAFAVQTVNRRLKWHGLAEGEICVCTATTLTRAKLIFS